MVTYAGLRVRLQSELGEPVFNAEEIPKIVRGVGGNLSIDFVRGHLAGGICVEGYGITGNESYTKRVYRESEIRAFLERTFLKTGKGVVIPEGQSLEELLERGRGERHPRKSWKTNEDNPSFDNIQRAYEEG